MTARGEGGSKADGIQHIQMDMDKNEFKNIMDDLEHSNLTMINNENEQLEHLHKHHRIAEDRISNVQNKINKISSLLEKKRSKIEKIRHKGVDMKSDLESLRDL